MPSPGPILLRVLTHTHKPSPDAEIAWDLTWPRIHGGTSSLFAVFVALGLGYEQVILAGCPLDKSSHFYEPPWRRCQEFNETLKHWEEAQEVFKGRVKSVSGRTRDLLGEP